MNFLNDILSFQNVAGRSKIWNTLFTSSPLQYIRIYTILTWCKQSCFTKTIFMQFCVYATLWYAPPPPPPPHTHTHTHKKKNCQGIPKFTLQITFAALPVPLCLLFLPQTSRSFVPLSGILHQYFSGQLAYNSLCQPEGSMCLAIQFLKTVQ